MKQNKALPGWCQILDELIAEECPENKAGVDVVLEAPHTSSTEHPPLTKNGGAQ